MLNLKTSFKHILLLVTPLLLIGCGGSSDGGGGCETIANADGPAFFTVENNLDTGLEWFLPAFAFAADMRPGECTIMGVTSRQFTVDLQQCNIGSNGCTSFFGPSKSVVFSVVDGETFTLTVGSDFFN